MRERVSTGIANASNASSIIIFFFNRLQSDAQARSGRKFAEAVAGQLR
jgi:hypothetical protein